MIVWIYSKIRDFISRITKRECHQCKHCIENIACDNFKRYVECVSGIYPKCFEQRK